MRKLILTDVDESVLEYCNPFQMYVESKGIKTYDRLIDVYTMEAFLRVPHEEARVHIEAFAELDTDVQPPLPCAKEVLPKLHAAGYDFSAITACGLDPVFRLKRWKGLERTFGFNWLDCHVVDLRASKGDALALHPPAVWVEDHFNHAVTGAEMGHRTFLLDKPYNRGNDHPLVTRVNDWHEIAAHLLGE